MEYIISSRQGIEATRHACCVLWCFANECVYSMLTTTVPRTGTPRESTRKRSTGAHWRRQLKTPRMWSALLATRKEGEHAPNTPQPREPFALEAPGDIHGAGRGFGIGSAPNPRWASRADNDGTSEINPSFGPAVGGHTSGV